MAELTPKQRKTFAKITEALQEFPFGATIQDLYNEARLSMTVIKNALEKMDSVEQRGDSWFLKTTDGSRAGEAVEPTVEQPVMQDSAENLQDNTENMQEEIGNTQDPHVSYHDNESSYPDNGEGALINPSAGVVNPSDIVSIDDLHPEFAQLPDYQSSNSQAIETASQGLAAELKQLDNAYLDGLASKAEAPNAEVGQATVNQKRFILIENCLLSLSRDEIGESPCLAKDCWFDSHGNDIPLESPDGQFLQKAAGGFCSDAIFRGEEYYRRYTLQSQLFHGVFDSPKDAEYRIAELMFIKPDKNHFEIIEV